MGDRAIVSSASPTESCPILKPVNSAVSNQLLRVAVRYSDFSVNQHAINFNLTLRKEVFKNKIQDEVKLAEIRPLMSVHLPNIHLFYLSLTIIQVYVLMLNPTLIFH